MDVYGSTFAGAYGIVFTVSGGGGSSVPRTITFDDVTSDGETVTVSRQTDTRG